MQFQDAIYPLPPSKSEFIDLLYKDPEFRLSFICDNNPEAIILNMRRLGLITDQNVMPEDVYNIMNLLLNAGRTKLVRRLLKVPLIPDAYGMTEPMLDGLIELEQTNPPTNAR